MRNINTISSIANVSRFSAQATVMLRGGNAMPALDTWRPICAGTFDDFGLYQKYSCKPSTGEAPEIEQTLERSFQRNVQHLTPMASHLFHRFS